VVAGLGGVGELQAKLNWTGKAVALRFLPEKDNNKIKLKIKKNAQLGFGKFINNKI
jgi:hypothetical protein